MNVSGKGKLIEHFNAVYVFARNTWELCVTYINVAFTVQMQCDVNYLRKTTKSAVA